MVTLKNGPYGSDAGGGAGIPGGRYYSRWLESDDHGLWRLACNCGYRSTWERQRLGLSVRADEYHRAH